MKVCNSCNNHPNVSHNVLFHKCKNVSLLISDINETEISKKWDNIQEKKNSKGIYFTNN